MTRDEILAELKRLEPWFHRIDLGDGLFTKTESVMGEPVDHPHQPWQIIQKLLPDLRGKTVLDVGCNAGFYAFEAKRRGAKRVLGVDGQRQHVRQGLFVRKVLGLDVEFRRVNVYEPYPRTGKTLRGNKGSAGYRNRDNAAPQDSQVVCLFVWLGKDDIASAGLR